MDNIAQAFLAEIETFLNAASLDPTTLGKQALGDPSFVFDLKNHTVYIPLNTMWLRFRAATGIALSSGGGGGSSSSSRTAPLPAPRPTHWTVGATS